MTKSLYFKINNFYYNKNLLEAITDSFISKQNFKNLEYIFLELDIADIGFT